MSNTAKRYFEQMGYIDSIRGNVMAHIATLPQFAQEAYAKGQRDAKPRVYLYKLNRSVGEYKSGTLFTRVGKLAEDTKGIVTVQLDGVDVNLPYSRLTLAV